MSEDTNITPEWCAKMAKLEGDQEIGAGAPDHPLRCPPVENVTQADIERAETFHKDSLHLILNGKREDAHALLVEALRDHRLAATKEMQDAINFYAGRYAERCSDVLVLKAAAKEMREALTPSAETKAAYMGEFEFAFEFQDEDGYDHTANICVPWTTIKEIMAAIRARAALKEETP